MAQQRQQVKDVVSRREGSRWIGDRPSGEELAEWFTTVRLDEGMKHSDWVGGITLISATETVIGLHNGDFVDFVRLVHVPYARVDARISYFWELCDVRGWFGEIKAVPVPRLRDSGYFNEHLPTGFGRMPIPLPDGKAAAYVTCTQKVSIYERDARSGEKGRLRRDPTSATKQLPLLNRWFKPDENVLMKCETSAVGRALGMAGVFVLPGSGVATAEDMTEFLAATGGGGGAGVAEPELPSDLPPELGVGTAPSIDSRIEAGMQQLEDDVDRYEAFAVWAEEKKINLKEPLDSQKRSVLRKLEQLIQEMEAEVE